MKPVGEPDAGDRHVRFDCREPDHPHHQRASQIERAEEIGQGGGFVRGGHDRLYQRQRRSGRLLRLPLDQRHRGLGLRIAAVHREAAWGFRQQATQREREQRRQRPEDEHVLPAEMRHDPQAGEACRHQADREHELVQEDEAPAALRLCQFADEDGGDRHLATEPDALDGAQHQERVVVPRQRAGEAHDREQRDRPDHRRHPPVALRDPTEQQRAQQLSEKPGRDHQPDLRRGELPQWDDDRQHRCDRQRVEGVEESGDADDDPRLHLPPRGGQALQPRDDVIDRRAGPRYVHVSLPWLFSTVRIGSLMPAAISEVLPRCRSRWRFARCPRAPRHR